MRKTRVFTRRVRDHDRSASQRVANTRMVDVSPREKRVFSPRGEHLVSRAPASFLSRLGLQDPRHRGLLTEVAPRLLTILQHWPDIPPVDKSTPIVRLVAFTDVSAQLGRSWLQVFVAAGWVLVVIGCTETQQSISPRGCWGASAASFGCSIAWCLVPLGICS